MKNRGRSGFTPAKGAVAIEVVAALYYIWKNPAQLPDFFHFQPLFEQILIIGDSE